MWLNNLNFVDFIRVNKLLYLKGLEKDIHQTLILQLPERIHKFKEELQKEEQSYYRDAVMRVYYNKG